MLSETIDVYWVYWELEKEKSLCWFLVLPPEEAGGGSRCLWRPQHKTSTGDTGSGCCLSQRCSYYDESLFHS